MSMEIFIDILLLFECGRSAVRTLQSALQISQNLFATFWSVSPYLFVIQYGRQC